MFSRPAENLMLSTAVSIGGNVLSTSLGLHALLERRVAFRIERLRVRHAAGHPQHDDGVRRGVIFSMASSPNANFG